MLPVLYSFRRCPYAMRARLAIAISNVHVELREVVLRDKPQSLLDASPKGTVPIIVNVNGSVIDESLDIMLWALSKGIAPNKHSKAWQPLSEKNKTAALQLIHVCDQPFKSCLDRYKYADRYPESSMERYRDQAMKYLEAWDKQLSISAYLLGDTPSLADIAIFPFVRQFAHVDKAWFMQCELGSLQHWLDQWLVSPLFLSIMHKYDQWQPMSINGEINSGVDFP